MEEIWKRIEGFENYEISNHGRVKNLKTDYFLKIGLMKVGYPAVSLFKCGKHYLIPVHRLLGLYFVENDEPIRKTQVNHLNGIRHDNRIENLEWVSQRENLSHGKLRMPNKSSKYLGVRFKQKVKPTSKNWEACITIKGKRVHLGCHFTEYEAHLAYRQALKDFNLVNKYF